MAFEITARITQLGIFSDQKFEELGQCIIDTIRNTYTSQEFIALSSNPNPVVMDAAMLRIAEPCVYKAYAYH